MQKPRPRVEEQETNGKPVNRLLAYFPVEHVDASQQSEEQRLIEESFCVMHRDIARAQQEFVEHLRNETQRCFLYALQLNMHTEQAKGCADYRRRALELETRPDLEMRIAFARNNHEIRVQRIHEYLADKQRQQEYNRQNPFPQKA
ncbi:MAG: hypothetical protein G01um101425_568 [Candidatus Peregrinibacteria bacterium Gr01-1014_25]|nr:MAG: hypothetical protein G01um101425_568 [Candidatus Peregrinibacteria bacterium Gr01-1014_25]